MLRRLNVGTKITVGFGVVTGLAMALGGLAVWQMHGIRGNSTQLVEEAAPMINAVNEVERHSLTVMYGMRGYGLTGDEKYLQEARSNLKELNGGLETCKQLAERFHVPGLQAAADKARESLDKYLALVEQTVTLDAAVTANRKSMNETAKNFADTYVQYLASQNDKLTAEIDKDATHDQVKQRIEKLRLINAVGDMINDCRVANMKSQAWRDASYAQDALPLFDKITEHLATIRKMTTQDVDIRRVETMQTTAQAYKADVVQAIEQANATTVLGRQRNEAGQVVLEQAEQSAVDGVQQVAAMARDSLTKVNTASTAMFVGLGAALVMAVTLSLVITRSIVRPIYPLLDRAKAIANGDLTAQDLPVTSQDEIGLLTGSVNEMCRSLKTLIASVTAAANDVAASAAEIAASSEETSGGMKEQAQQVTQISSSIEQMSASITEVAQKASDAASNATSSGTAASEGGQVIKQTIEDIEAISQAASGTAANINELSKRSDEIGQIVQVVSEVAEQINLLALNAAIEAARAGEHGRGFAVVADEVRQLADRTTQATKEIGGLIKAIQTETIQAVQQVQGSSKQVQASVERTARAEASLQKIVGGTTQVAEMVQSIAAAAEEQSAASEEISGSVETINNLAHQASEGAEQAAEAATQLSNKAEQLLVLVSRFKVEAGQRVAQQQH